MTVHSSEGLGRTFASQGQELEDRGPVSSGDASPGAAKNGLANLAFQKAAGAVKVRSVFADREVLARPKQRRQAS
jgi:hypothetical protein